MVGCRLRSTEAVSRASWMCEPGLLHRSTWGRVALLVRPRRGPPSICPWVNSVAVCLSVEDTATPDSRTGTTAATPGPVTGRIFSAAHLSRFQAEKRKCCCSLLPTSSFLDRRHRRLPRFPGAHPRQRQPYRLDSTGGHSPLPS